MWETPQTENNSFSLEFSSSGVSHLIQRLRGIDPSILQAIAAMFVLSWGCHGAVKLVTNHRVVAVRTALRAKASKSGTVERTKRSPRPQGRSQGRPKRSNDESSGYHQQQEEGVLDVAQQTLQCMCCVETVNAHRENTRE